MPLSEDDKTFIREEEEIKQHRNYALAKKYHKQQLQDYERIIKLVEECKKYFTTTTCKDRTDFKKYKPQEKENYKLVHYYKNEQIITMVNAAKHKIIPLINSENEGTAFQGEFYQYETHSSTGVEHDEDGVVKLGPIGHSREKFEGHNVKVLPRECGNWHKLKHFMNFNIEVLPSECCNWYKLEKLHNNRITILPPG
eukprot:Pgem_evm1s695